MELKESDRLRVRLLAIDLRLAELSHEMERTQVQVQRLETELEDARLASLMDEEGADVAALAPELERRRDSLEIQRELVDRVKQSQWRARVAHSVQCLRERKAAQEGAPQEPDEA